MRRKPGELVPLEASILEAALELRHRGAEAAHGFLLAREMQYRTGARRLTAHGTLYKALERMEKAGFFESYWEDPAVAAEQGRPRRRFYRVTVAGESVLAKHRSSRSELAPRLDPRRGVS